MRQSLSESVQDFYLGCAIWAYKGWLGDFFPPGSVASHFLKLYAQRLTTVEVNATFYSTPTPETVGRWAEQTPEHFQFCPKFPRTVTHAGPLQPHTNEAMDFIQLMQGLGPRLGPIFAQLPPPLWSPKLFRPSHISDRDQNRRCASCRGGSSSPLVSICPC